jgi:hypothetical protein
MNPLRLFVAHYLISSYFRVLKLVILVIIHKFSNRENPGIEHENPDVEKALKSCAISGLDSLLVIEPITGTWIHFDTFLETACKQIEREVRRGRTRHHGALRCISCLLTTNLIAVLLFIKCMIKSIYLNQYT